MSTALFYVGEGELYECLISRFLQVYAEFLVIAFIKDCICMNILLMYFRIEH